MMVNRYRQAARTALEAGLGDVYPLDESIPEAAAALAAADAAAEPIQFVTVEEVDFDEVP